MDSLKTLTKPISSIYLSRNPCHLLIKHDNHVLTEDLTTRSISWPREFKQEKSIHLTQTCSSKGTKQCTIFVKWKQPCFFYVILVLYTLWKYYLLQLKYYKCFFSSNILKSFLCLFWISGDVCLRFQYQKDVFLPNIHVDVLFTSCQS